VFLFSFQPKSQSWEILRILQREKETFLTLIRFPAIVLVPVFLVPFTRFPFNRSEATENIPFHIQNQRQSICVTITTTVKVEGTETITTATS
jgi:hypothetical protein